MPHRNDNEIVRNASAPMPGQALELDNENGDDAQSLWNMVNGRLSGRWRVALILGGILACIGAIAGYRATTVKYESTGIIHVSPKSGIVMREIPETGMVPRFPSFIQTQATLISSSPRVLERSLQSIELAKAPWTDRLSAMRIIRNGLSAKVARDSELIQVTFAHESPVVAQAVVNAVIRAYAEFHVSADGDDINQTLRKLRSVRESLRNQRMQRQSQIQDIIASSDHASNEMGEIISQKAMRLQHIDAEARQLEHLLAMADAHGIHKEVDTDVMGEDPATGAAIDPRDLEAFDSELARLAKQRDEARSAMARVRERFLPRHRAYAAAEEDLRIAESLYQDRMVLAAEQFVSSDRLSLMNWAMEPRQRLTQLRREADQERRLLMTMQQTQLKLDELRAEVEEIQDEERETAARIRSLSIEADSIRRISIASLGELPSQPAQDRRAALAAVGAFGGLGMSIGFFFLLASLDQRVYGVAQLNGASANRQLLGVLPALPTDRGDLESSGVAAHCIHQIRNRIEAARRPGRSAVIAISSPYQGDGKTSLTLALAASYAASGYRTLLIDCDMVGRSLSHNLMMTGQPGFQECLEGDDAEHFIRPLQFENLHVLPVGGDHTLGPERVRKSDVDVLFQRLRRLYDIVLIDTGPLIGSVESIPVASAADSVVLTMWRGRRQSRLNDCIRALQSAGVQYLGVILNYALQSDCNRYLSCSKTSAMAATNGHSASTRTRHDSTVSRNALLRAMQVTARARPRRYVETSNTPD